MFEDFDSPNDGLSQDDAHNILRELEKNQSEEIRRQRSHFRVSVRVPITIQPGNASDRLSYKVQGVTGDISESGLGALLPLPTRVGDIYRLAIDRGKLDLPMMYARCVRCHLVREDAFEAGFLFFSPIGLPASLAAQAT